MRIPDLTRLSSDQLRHELSKNNRAMNALAEANERIAKTLKDRGLKAVPIGLQLGDPPRSR